MRLKQWSSKSLLHPHPPEALLFFFSTRPQEPEILLQRMILGHDQAPVTMAFSVRVLHSCVTVNF